MILPPILWLGAALGDFRPGRRNRKPIAFVIHVMDGTERGTDAWFQDPKSHVSAHYGISKTGEVHQYVKVEDTAFHAGTVVDPVWPWLLEHPGVNPNNYTIGIEHEGLATDIWPDAQYQASAALIASLAPGLEITISRSTVVRHREIRANKTCPGLCDLDRLIALATAV